MCVIVDANLASHVFATPAHAEFKPILDWLFHKDGVLVCGGENMAELQRVGAAARAIKELLKSNRTILFSESDLEKDKKFVARHRIASDDPHVLALARASKARTLVSDDELLHEDFKNRTLIPAPKGMIYQNSGHRKCLKHTEGCCKKKHDR
jgi:predicted nucleic acid-binding protein